MRCERKSSAFDEVLVDPEQDIGKANLPRCQHILKGRWPVTATTVIILTVLVALFAAFAGSLAWIQQHARQLSTASMDAPRPRRRPF
jgi:hypothetical protein